MSINSLANSALARRSDFSPAGRAPGTYSEIASAAAAANPPLAGPAPANPAAPAPAATTVDTAVNVLTGYIPAEILTGYVAVLAALNGSPKLMKVEWIAFWIFLVATPVVLWIVYATKIKGAGKPLPFSYSSWPLWEMAASTVAFFAWAFALPNNPFTTLDWYSAPIAALVVLVASSVLGLLAPLFGSGQLNA
jgi:hypothetical protein